MNSTSVVIFFLMVAVFFGSIGWLVDRFSDDERRKKRSVFVSIKRAIASSPYLFLLYFFSFYIIQGGFKSMLHSFGMIDRDASAMSLTVSFFLVIFIYEYVTRKRNLIKNLYSIVRFSIANDVDFFHKMSSSDPVDFSRDRNIPLSFIIKNKNAFSVFFCKKDVVNKIKIDDVDGLIKFSMEVRDSISLAKNIGRDIGVCGGVDWGIVYRKIKELDGIVVSFIPDNLAKKYRVNFYSFRLKFLEDVLPWLLRNECMDMKDIDRDIVLFYRAVLDKFYEQSLDYKFNPCGEFKCESTLFDAIDFEKYFQDLS